MKKLFFIILAAVFLSACSAAPAAPTPNPTPEPTPPPTEYTITNESPEKILALSEISSLEYIDACKCTEYDALLKLKERMPDCEIVWQYEFQGQKYESTATELKVYELEGLEDAIRYLPELTYIDLIEAGATVEDLDRYSAINPDIFFLWEFKHDGFTIRTDIQVYSSLRGNNMKRFDGEDMYPMLKYCKKLKALDIGHCNLEDISLIGELTELEVLILAENPYITDASPIGNLKDLEYLELFLCQNIEDTSFLNELTKMKDLNMCYVPLESLDFLGNMPDMKLFYCKYCSTDDEEYNYWKEHYPEASFVSYNGDINSCDSTWRGTERNYHVRYMFANWRHVVEYRHYDDIDFDLNTYFY